MGGRTGVREGGGGGAENSTSFTRSASDQHI